MTATVKRPVSPALGPPEAGRGALALHRERNIPAGRGEYHKINGLACPTAAYGPIGNIGEYRRLSNPEPPPEIESLGASGNATEANRKAVSFKTEEYRKRADAATALCHAIADCHPADAAIVMSAALGDMCLGAPIPPLLSVMDEARSWAEWATPVEHKAYALACYSAMPPKAQAGFLAHVMGRAVA